MRKLVVTLLVLIALAMLGSLHFGVTLYSPQQVFNALFHFSGSNADSAIYEYRLPRAIIAPIVGASLAVAGVIIQTLTRNMLASPGLLGINSGAAVAVAVAMILLGIGSQILVGLFAILGAFAACVIVYIIAFAGGRGEMSSARLVLVGFTFSALLYSFIELIMVIDEVNVSTMLIWLSGSFTNKRLDLLWVALPPIISGMMIAFSIARHLDVIMVDDDMAKSLGVPVNLIRNLIFVAVSLLAGGSIMLAGPLGFVGLIIPHIARRFVGTQHRALLPVSALFGALFTLLADISCRLILYPAEIPVGILTSLIGVPFFIYLISRKPAANGGTGRNSAGEKC